MKTHTRNLGGSKKGVCENFWDTAIGEGGHSFCFDEAEAELSYDEIPELKII